MKRSFHWHMTHWLSESIESWHRMSWRVFAWVPAFIVAGAFGLGACAWAAEGVGLVSKEGEKVTMTKQRQISVVKESPKKPVKDKQVKLPEFTQDEENAAGPTRTLRGQVAGRNNYGLAVEYATEDKLGVQEDWLTFNSKTRVSGAKSFSSLELGDTVQVTYKEMMDGSKRKIVKQVTLIAKKPKEPEPPVEPEPAPSGVEGPAPEPESAS